ncbi:MAG TPA: hypothetical protein VIJ42_10485 [Stellaceae bacterium]
MESAVENPFVIFAGSLVAQALAAYLGYRFRPRSVAADAHGDFDLVHGAALTLLALLIGFTFSMAVSRYDQRVTHEEEEANAIGTGYLRADLLANDDAASVRAVLRRYIATRIDFYEAREPAKIVRAEAETASLQNQLWSVAAKNALAQPTPVMALAVTGINDVLDSQGRTQAAWLNRIPGPAWALTELTALACNILLGYRLVGRMGMLFILPVVTSISFFLIADIDSPRSGIVDVIPLNLVMQAEAMKAP